MLLKVVRSIIKPVADILKNAEPVSVEEAEDMGLEACGVCGGQEKNSRWKRKNIPNKKFLN